MSFYLNGRGTKQEIIWKTLFVSYMLVCILSHIACYCFFKTRDRRRRDKTRVVPTCKTSQYLISHLYYNLAHIIINNSFYTSVSFWTDLSLDHARPSNLVSMMIEYSYFRRRQIGFHSRQHFCLLRRSVWRFLLENHQSRLNPFRWYLKMCLVVGMVAYLTFCNKSRDLVSY